MWPAPIVGAGFFPLDEELQLPEGQLLPRAQQALVRLGTLLPFAKAAEQLFALLGVRVSGGTARRQTERVAQRCLQVQTQQAHPRAACPEERAAERMIISPDGCMISLVGQQWVEVKVVAMGEVGTRSSKQGPVRCTRHLSYFARLAEAATFAELASAEVRRRGIERAEAVCAVQDGAEWLQGFVQSHRADALRILDFAHAAGYISDIGDVVRASGRHLPAHWLDGVLHRLKHEGPQRVLRHLEALAKRCPDPLLTEKLRYLQKRQDLMHYPAYQQAGWPIGSGIVESGHKVLVQARLKGAGMHWQRHNVNPMLAIRMAFCNERWEESWQAQDRERREQQQRRRQQRHRARARQYEAKREELRALLAALSSPPPQAPASKKGRTQAQKQWGRQTFSPRMLRQGGYAK